MTTFNTDTTETALPLDLTVNQFSVGGVTGLVPTVAVRLAATGTPQYLDWASNTVKTSGWTTKYQNMTEIERGHYQQLLNISVLSLAVGVKLIAEYAAVVGGVTYTSSDTVLVNNIASQVTLLRQIGKNKLVELSGNPGTLTLYADDTVTVLETWTLTDENGNAVLPAIGTPARRSAGIP